MFVFYDLESRNDNQGAEEVEFDETSTPHKLVHLWVPTIYFKKLSIELLIFLTVLTELSNAV